MLGRYEILPRALEIPGVRTVTVFSTLTRSKIWSIDNGQPAIDERVVAAAIDMTAAVQRLVDLADPDGSIHEILAVDATWFHVLYLLVDQDSGQQVVHILLDRSRANLAQARREFWAMVEAGRLVRREPQPPAGDVRMARVDPQTAPRAIKPARLPRRTPTAPAGPEMSTGDEASHRDPSWMDHLAGPFLADVPTLNGVLEGLRRL